MSNEIDWKNPFKPEDFGEACLIEWESTKERPIGAHIADTANARFRELVEKCEIFEDVDQHEKYRMVPMYE